MNTVAFPKIETERLILRAFTIADSSEVQRMAGKVEVASNTLAMPFPYHDGMAEAWISTHQQEFEDHKSVILAIELKAQHILAGAIGLSLQFPYNNAELGYWIGQEYWGKGYCTEAVKAMIEFGFQHMKLHKIYANYFHNNPASGRVMKKAGMKYEAILNSHLLHWGEYKDLICYGIWNKQDEQNIKY